jgi:hypothetical protein
MTGLHAGDRVWVGAGDNSVPGHILSIHAHGDGTAEYVVRTLDLGGKPGENLNLRVRDSGPQRLIRQRGVGELQETAGRRDLGHVLD